MQMQKGLEKLDETFIREAFNRAGDSSRRPWVATYGYCLECGARIDPKRLRPAQVNLFCMGCEQAAERMVLLTAVMGS